MFSHLSVSHSVHWEGELQGSMRGRGSVWQGACMEGGVQGRGPFVSGAYVVGGMHGRRDGQTATAADGMHPTGMLSC